MLVELIEVAQVFPAHAGMSRFTPPTLRVDSCFPRSRGDEPREKWVPESALTFSPLTRG